MTRRSRRKQESHIRRLRSGEERTIRGAVSACSVSVGRRMILRRSNGPCVMRRQRDRLQQDATSCRNWASKAVVQVRRYLGVLFLLSSEFNRSICFTAGVPCVRGRPSACVDSLDFGCDMPCKLPELICTGLNALLSWFSYNKLGSLTVLYICFFVTIIRTSCFFVIDAS